MPEITDAYGHCGLRKYRPLPDVIAVSDRFGVARSVLVQHMGEFDNGYIGGAVRENPERFAGVFLVDMDAPDARDAISRWAATGHFRGIRMAAPSILTHLALWQHAAALGLQFVVSAPFPPAPAQALGRFAAANPGNLLQLTHLGLPVPADAPRFASLDPMLALASAGNVNVQVSGMHQRSQAPYSELLPAIHRVYEAFGPQRVLYGSNFPVMGEDTVYGLEIEMLRSGKLGISASALPEVMDANARQIWFRRQSLRAGSLVWRCAFG
ncbi:MAG: amidohydrolase family protein [Bryobacterales bacterium]|nr:amidohydrolase family protein [Bryobacterales bacterium]